MVVGDVTTGTEVLVIGGGPGGYVAAIRAAQHGLDVSLVETDTLGGTCVNHGCIPSKAYISATDLAHELGDAEDRGIFANPAVDLSALRSWKDGVVRRLSKGVEALCDGAGVTVVSGRAEFASPEKARIVHGGDGQGSETIAFDHAIVATGSRPIELPQFGFDGTHILSSRDALALESVPDSLLVVGAGYIGMELATVCAKIGADVTVIEQFDQVLPGYEADVASVIHDRASDLGVEVHLGMGAVEWEEFDAAARDGSDPAQGAGEAAGSEEAATTGVVVRAEPTDDSPGGVPTESGERADEGEGEREGEDSAGAEEATREFVADACLVAVGRRPVTDTVNLEAAGVETDENGFIDTDDEARTNVNHIFAVGDVAGEPMLAHKAFTEGEVAADVLAGEPAALDHQAMPAAVFTDPEIGTVGMTEAEAADAGFDPVVGEMPLRASGRALTVNERDGFVRIVAEGDAGFVLGAQIVAPEASELLAEVALAIEMGATLEDLAATVHVHPTLSEAVHEAAMGASGESLHY